ncbi:glycerophosphodiester phosphodiesterase [Flavihumibacter fluvii]|uniref:glycerophosphodiester phosphodiesterase n=1 Tax=Flavihumibacter fluvii TaxID=2838157 RepID=UPI001BDE2A2F|nr:glycerophosphodiester phosphodiesterase family protein [Flavihumibacter fluvii]ULQ52138.1 glycerophosphodiester phosphodiesterase family protein [Flavihumibacter fluvii]
MKKTRAVIMATCFLLLVGQWSWSQQAVAKKEYRLIAHRGGVVDSTASENSLQALEKAAARGYWMVEIDVRLTKDGMLITHHDNSFKRSFGVDSTVGSMNWADISQLRNSKGYRVQSLEEVFQFCKGRLGVMIDNKIRGNDTAVWVRLIALLEKYGLDDTALMIGTDESTDYFRGKIRLSCTRQQLEENMRKAGYKSSDYYLFSGNISKEDAAWARGHGILAVGVVNAWSFSPAEAAEKARTQAGLLIRAGVDCFQIDAEFEELFRGE